MLTVNVSVSAAHSGADTTGYQLIIDGNVVATKPVAELADGRITFPLDGQTGRHEVKIAAYRDPETSAPITVDLGS